MPHKQEKNTSRVDSTKEEIKLQKKKIFNRVDSIREDKELLQNAFAHSININETSYSKLKKSEQSLSLEQIINISNVYNVNLNWLFQGGKEDDKYLKSLLPNKLDRVIEYIDGQKKASSFSKNKIVMLALEILIEKISLKKNIFIGENKRIILLLMEVLQIILEEEKEDVLDCHGYLDFILTKIDGKSKDEKKWYKNTAEKYIQYFAYKLKKLTEQEVYILVNFADEIILLLNDKFNYFEKIFFMKKNLRRKTSKIPFLNKYI